MSHHTLEVALKANLEKMRKSAEEGKFGDVDPGKDDERVVG